MKESLSVDFKAYLCHGSWPLNASISPLCLICALHSTQFNVHTYITIPLLAAHLFSIDRYTFPFFSVFLYPFHSLGTQFFSFYSTDTVSPHPCTLTTSASSPVTSHHSLLVPGSQNCLKLPKCILLLDTAVFIYTLFATLKVRFSDFRWLIWDICSLFSFSLWELNFSLPNIW